MAITDVTRNLGPSVSQSHTSDAVGHAEDLSPVITNIAPDVAFFLSEFPKEEAATSLKFSWMTEGLRPPMQNAHLEKEEYESQAVGSLNGLENNCQRFVSSGYVTEAQRKVKKAYKEQDEKARIMTNILTQHARDIEYALVNNAVTNPELNKSTPAITGGVPYFMKLDTQDCTVEASGNTVTTSEPHHLVTGDFVYFEASTMPTGLKANIIYYVRVDDDAPTTKFTLYDTMKDAVENVSDKIVKVGSAGTGVKLVKNNVVDLGGKKDYTLDDINNVMQMAFNRGGNPTMAVMSPAKKNLFSKLVTAATTINRDMTKGRRLEMVADAYETDFGAITAKAHRLYPDDRIDMLDMQYWGIKDFVPTHEVKGIAKTGSYDEMFVETWTGLKATQPLASGSITGIKR